MTIKPEWVEKAVGKKLSLQLPLSTLDTPAVIVTLDSVLTL